MAQEKDTDAIASASETIFQRVFASGGNEAQPGAPAPQSPPNDAQSEKDKELERMRKLLAEKEAQIASMQEKLKKDDGTSAEGDTSAKHTLDDGESKMPPASDVTLSVKGIPEFDQYPFSMSADRFYFMASIKAPYFRSDDRAAIDLVAVVDESGSMGGDRIKLVKETVQFVIKNLESADRFGIIGYSNGSREVLPLTKMDDSGKLVASKLASGLTARGGTALCAGLVAGVNMMRNRKGGNDVASVMLFTDGQANQGPTSAGEINRAVLTGRVHGGRSSQGLMRHRASRNRRQAGPALHQRRVPREGAPMLPIGMQQQQQQVAPPAPQGAPPPMPPGVRPQGVPPPMLQQQGVPARPLPQQQGVPAVPPPGQAPPMPGSIPPPILQQPQQQLQGVPPTVLAPVPTVPAPPPETEGKEEEGPEKLELEESGELPCTINTFGFGTGHNESLLESIAENGRGMYAFIENTTMIADTFAECLGGLVSIIGQNIKVNVEALNDVEINKCLSKGDGLRVVKPRKVHEVSIKNLQSEESRDLIFDLKVPKVDGKRADDPLVRFTVQYKNVVRDKDETLVNLCCVNRIEGTQIGERNMELDVQYNRVLAADAMEEADMLATKGKLDDARKVLSRAQEHIKKSKSSANKFSTALVKDIQVVTDNMRSRHDYARKGGKMLKMNKKAQRMQRSVQSDAYASQAVYQNRSKMAMKSKFRK